MFSFSVNTEDLLIYRLEEYSLLELKKSLKAELREMRSSVRLPVPVFLFYLVSIFAQVPCFVMSGSRETVGRARHSLACSKLLRIKWNKKSMANGSTYLAKNRDLRKYRADCSVIGQNNGIRCGQVVSGNTSEVQGLEFESDHSENLYVYQSG